MRVVLAGAEAPGGEASAALLEADPRTEVLVAEEAGAPVGFAVFFDLPEVVFARRCGALDDLFVLPAARGRGASCWAACSATSRTPCPWTWTWT